MSATKAVEFVGGPLDGETRDLSDEQQEWFVASGPASPVYPHLPEKCGTYVRCDGCGVMHWTGWA